MAEGITDWDDAYANGVHIPGGAGYPARWLKAAAAFRDRHPPTLFQGGHLFRSADDAHGLAVFIHGGYWMETSPAFWSHLAEGPLAAGWAVGLPAYPLAPAARIAEMTRAVAGWIAAAAAEIRGPIAICGHSAGGHLAARMVCADMPLGRALTARIRACVPISALSDLRPLMLTAMNATLGITEDEAVRESPARLRPLPDIPVTAWVGADERPEFIRQSRLLADSWAGHGAPARLVIRPGRHHFDVIEGLSRPESPLTRALIGA